MLAIKINAIVQTLNFKRGHVDVHVISQNVETTNFLSSNLCLKFLIEKG